MKIKEILSYNSNSKMKAVFSKIIQENLDNFNFCLAYLKEKVGAFFPEYVKKLESNLNLLGQQDQISDDALALLNQFTLFSELPSLFMTVLRVYLSLCRYSHYQPVSLNQTVWIEKNDFLRGFLFLRFYAVRPLLDFVPRDKAIAFVKTYVDFHALHKRVPQKTENVEDIINMNKAPAIYQKSFNSTSFVYDQGIVGMKINKCRWCEVMRGLKDPEFCAAVVCHFDFQDATLMNKNFVLTRTQTLMEGEDYCDFVWHDTRTDKKCAHPEKAFWDQLR